MRAVVNDEDKPEPADEQLLWIVLAFIVFMLLVMVLNTYVSR